MTERDAVNKLIGATGEKIALKALREDMVDGWEELGYTITIKRVAPHHIHPNPKPYDGYLSLECRDIDEKTGFLIEVKTTNSSNGSALRISNEQMERYLQISKDHSIDYIFIFVDLYNKAVYKVPQESFLRCRHIGEKYQTYMVDIEDIIADVSQNDIISFRQKLLLLKKSFSNSLFD